METTIVEPDGMETVEGEHPPRDPRFSQAHWLQEARKEYNLTHHDVAELLGMEPAEYIQVEAGVRMFSVEDFNMVMNSVSAPPVPAIHVFRMKKQLRGEVLEELMLWVLKEQDLSPSKFALLHHKAVDWVWKQVIKKIAEMKEARHVETSERLEGR